jgi:TolB-like protein
VRLSNTDPPPNRLKPYAWRPGLNAAAAITVAIAIAWFGWRSPAHQQVTADAAPRLSIVVLPFANLNQNGEQPHFAQAITDDLTTDLSRMQDIIVIPVSSLPIPGDRPINTKQLASELRARYVLEGSTQWSRDGVRINAQLIDAESGANVWSQRIDRDAGDDLALESEISGHLTVSLKYALVSVEAARPTENPDVWDYIVRGRAASYNPSSRQNYDRQLLLFSKALELNPHSVDAKLGLAMAYAGRVLDLMSNEKQLDLERAQDLIDQARADAPRSPLVHFAMAQLLRARGRCEEAMNEYEAVLVFNRNWSSALSHLGRCKTYLGRVDESIALLQKVIQLGSPNDIGLAAFRLGEAYLLKSRPQEAIPWLEKARVAQPAMGYVHGHLASAYALEQQPELAARELAEARRLIPWRYTSIATEQTLGREFGVSPNPALWATLLDGLRKAGVPD